MEAENEFNETSHSGGQDERFEERRPATARPKPAHVLVKASLAVASARVLLFACILNVACVLDIPDYDYADYSHSHASQEECDGIPSISGGLTCEVKDIKCTCYETPEPCEHEDLPAGFKEPVLYFEAECVISNSTPYQVELSWCDIDNCFCNEVIYAGGDERAVRMRTRGMGLVNPRSIKYFTLDANETRQVTADFSARDHAKLCNRMSSVKWQMLDRETLLTVRIMPDASGRTAMTTNAVAVSLGITFPRTLSLEDIGGCPQKWTDPLTGMTWTYTIFSKEVSLGSGCHDVIAVRRNTAGDLAIPAEIDGMPVV